MVRFQYVMSLAKYSRSLEHTGSIFVVLTGFTFVTLFATFFVLILVSAIAFAGEFFQLNQLVYQKITDINQQISGGRHLLGYTTRFSVASRLLQYYNNGEEDCDNNYNSDYGHNSYPDSDASFPIGTSLIGAMLAVYLLGILAISLVNSLCNGAMVHAVAEVYAGNTLVPKNSIKRGWGKKWTDFRYQLILGFTSFMLFVVTFMLPVFFDIQHAINVAEEDLENVNFMDFIRVFKFAMITGLVFLIIVVIIGSLLQATVPAMIVEHKSATDAFKRSFELCKKCICIIFCTNFCFHFIMFIGIVIVNSILDDFPTFLSGWSSCYECYQYFNWSHSLLCSLYVDAH